MGRERRFGWLATRAGRTDAKLPAGPSRNDFAEALAHALQ
jgi:hypothetical protein